MTKRVVEHEIKLEKSVKIILGVLALGVLLNALAPAFSVREAFAELSSGSRINVSVSGSLMCEYGSCQN
jgi:hypothetical protein